MAEQHQEIILFVIIKIFFGYVNSGNIKETLKGKILFIEVEKIKYPVDILSKPLNSKDFKIYNCFNLLYLNQIAVLILMRKKLSRYIVQFRY